MKSTNDLKSLHESLCHPGITRLWEYIRRHNLPFSLEEVRQLSDTCKTCLECKPVFFHPDEIGKIIRASKPFERLGMDIIGPKKPAHPSGNQWILSIVDKYSRFPFAFGLKDITSKSIINCLKQLFSLFGVPGFIHTDRGTQFISQFIRLFLS